MGNIKKKKKLFFFLNILQFLNSLQINQAIRIIIGILMN
jgi:hypothetical protein